MQTHSARRRCGYRVAGCTPVEPSRVAIRCTRSRSPVAAPPHAEAS
ncbi:hypothetical protein OG819_47030 [Streptomyces sp. NBC_01549]|nr:hypothetical protein [Streptomyces sp. NBC_01549]MCX4596922.1 hypothetical protein [Streptomyces sp. NBC_01549]